MSNYYDIKKLCHLSRLEIDDSEIQQTAEKIKEIISFFNKLDEFEMSESNEDSNNKNNSYSNPLKLEKKLNHLRDDIPNKKININSEDINNSLFDFKFHIKKNGYVIGPKI
ncbi:MAG TPA: hypothetical protein VN704_05765 [Verrucomicrobiae bacterium]|nr:hypothetical protein [Verrucomicrobiae bacterium]